MKQIVIVGAGGLGREVAWLIERINEVESTWDLLGFIDDNPLIQGTTFNGYKVIGDIDSLDLHSNIYVVCAIGSSKTRRTVIERIQKINSDIRFATLIDPSVKYSHFVEIGEGTIVCANSILTTNIMIGKHVVICVGCTIGHDVILEDYVTSYPSVNVSGNVLCGECAELGVGSQIIQGKKIGDETIVGAGAVVIDDLPKKCTAVGVPCHPIKYFN